MIDMSYNAKISNTRTLHSKKASKYLYVIIAFAGGAMGIAGIHNVSLFGEPMVTMGTIASFLMLSRNLLMRKILKRLVR